MIKVSHLDKTYYKGKSNEIHVINDTSLELPNTGLVFFLGQSGSGKTTLLNAIGGLDKADKGTIQYEDTVVSKYKMSRVDKFRSTNIGYVFQNYLLLEDLSVYENLRLALELIGINDPDEVKKRIEYVLKSVGLYRFRKKLAGQLSGGQQQRVSIARALIKKTKIIIADEPTGNLDSENTIDVMNILKKISKDTLVLVVTHNEDIAQFYADRIVKLKDGKIESDIVNESSGSLEAKSDKKIHLLDLEESNIEEGKLSLKLYTDDSTDLHNVTIVIKNNTIYIDSPTRLQVIPGSTIELINDHYKKLELDQVDTFDYDITWYNDNARKNKFVESIKDLGRMFLTFYSESKRKFFNIVFILIGIAIGILVLLQTNYSKYDLSDISTEEDIYYIEGISSWDDTQYITEVRRKDLVDAVINGYVDDLYGPSFSDNNTITINLNVVNSNSVYFSGDSFPYSYVMDKGLACGVEPKNADEIVLGYDVANKIIDQIGNGFTMKDLIGLKSGVFVIVGVSKIHTNSIYKYNLHNASYKDYEMDKDSTIDYIDRIDASSLTFVEGRGIENPNEMIISEILAMSINLNDVIDGVTVVGIFESYDEIAYTNSYAMLSNKIVNGNVEPKEYIEAYEEYPTYSTDIFKYKLISGTEPKQDECLASIYSSIHLGDVINGLKVVGFYYPLEETYTRATADYVFEDSTYYTLLTTAYNELVCSLNNSKCYGYEFDESLYGYRIKISKDKYDAAEEYFASKEYKLESVYEAKKKEIISDSNASKKVFPIIEAVLLAIILIYTYFSERAKMISEVHDIGVLRSLGAKRSKIIGRIVKELFVKATLTTFLGYIISIIVYFALARQINGVMEKQVLSTSPYYILLGVAVLYVTQIIIGLLPYVLLLRKTPSEINSKYDI